MFCKKCGQQLPDGIKFCTKCGTPTAAAQNPAAQRTVNPQMRPQNPQMRPQDPQMRPQNPQMRPQTPPQRPMNAPQRPMPRPQPAYAPTNNSGYIGQFRYKLGPAMIGYFVLVVLLVLSFIMFSNSAIIQGKEFGETVTADMAEIMEHEDGLESIPAVTTVIHIVALVVLLLPFVPKIRLSALLMVLTRITFLWDAFWTIIVLATYTENGRAKATFGAILIIIIALAAFIYSFILSRQNKKYVKSKKQRAPRPQMH